jgi:two-component system chemotaxis response regulator CheY
MRALIIDDSRAMRRILARLMKDAGFETFEAGNGREALDVLGAHLPIDIALVDWNMPVMDGLEFVRAVRAVSTYDAVRLLMVTTESESARIELALGAGANEYILKPFDGEAIRSKLELLGIGAE